MAKKGRSQTAKKPAAQQQQRQQTAQSRQKVRAATAVQQPPQAQSQRNQRRPATATSQAASAAAGSLSGRREERARGRMAASQAYQRRKKMQRIGIGVVALLVVAVAAVFIYREATEEPPERVTTGIATATDPGQLIPSMGGEHVGQGADVDNYNSDPPTSGDHFASTAPWGVKTEEVQDELQVHNLEHGGVVIQYDCPDGCPEVVEQLTPLATQYSVKLIMAPRDNMEHLIAITAWNRLLTMDEVNTEQIQAFIDAYVDQGPEKIGPETEILEAERAAQGQ